MKVWKRSLNRLQLRNRTSLLAKFSILLLFTDCGSEKYAIHSSHMEETEVTGVFTSFAVKLSYTECVNLFWYSNRGYRYCWSRFLFIVISISKIVLSLVARSAEQRSHNKVCSFLAFRKNSVIFIKCFLIFMVTSIFDE